MKLICAVSVLQEKLKVGHQGERSLESFCQWQYQEFGGPRYIGTNHIPGGRDDIPPVDTAVFVTRYVGKMSSDEWMVMNDKCIECGLSTLAWTHAFIFTTKNIALFQVRIRTKSSIQFILNTTHLTRSLTTLWHWCWFVYEWVLCCWPANITLKGFTVTLCTGHLSIRCF